MHSDPEGFICLGGCNGFSPVMKNCGTKGCKLEGRPLKPGSKCSECGKTFLKGERHAH